jgi:hypothetical protein
LKSVLEARGRVHAFLESKNHDLAAADMLLEGIPEDAQVLRSRVVLAAYPEDSVRERAEAAYNLVQAGGDVDGRGLAYLKSVADRDPEGYYARIVDEKLLSRLNAGLSKVMKAQEDENADGAPASAAAETRKAADSLLAVTMEAEKRFQDKERRQTVYLFRAFAYRALNDQDNVDAAWKQAVALDSEAPILEKVKPMIQPSDKALNE